MTQEEYIKERNRIQANIHKWENKVGDLDMEYLNQAPFPIGTLVEMTILPAYLVVTEWRTAEEPQKIRGIVGSWNIDSKTGEFRPNLFRPTKDGGIGKYITYTWQSIIVKIEKVRDPYTCSDCLWRMIEGGKMFCKSKVVEHEDKYSNLSVKPTEIMCSDGTKVEWKDNVPYKK